MRSRNLVLATALQLVGCFESVTLGDLGGPETAGDGGTSFACTPPDGSTQAPITFGGTLFNVTNGCLEDTSVTLPVCGCFHGTGKDTSTWCFSAPDGTTYFATSDDQCSVEMPAGWYATQTFGPSPFGTPSTAQASACGRLAASSTSKSTGTYDRLGPPRCGTTDGGVEASLPDGAARTTAP